MTYKLLWQDNFDQDGFLDPDIWTIETGGSGFGNNEAQFYTNQEKNIFVKDHMLHIQAHKENYENRNYTSGKLVTYQKKHIKYGRIEVEAKLPKGKGTWPAIWLLGENKKETGWPLCGEIDLIEHIGRRPGQFHFSLHTKSFNHKNNNHLTYVYEDLSLLDGFQVFSIEWDEKQISFYINNRQMATFKKSKNATVEDWPYDQPFYLIINLAIGGHWGGDIDDNIFPVELNIKSVKVYERSGS
jgi:beta-glucanase (GH16 family)